ncbi:MAG: SIS domain-containing protein [bacterium]
MKKLEELIIHRAQESARLQESFCQQASGQILQITKSLAKVIQNGGKILVAGNGGSAADAQHFAAEMVNRFLMERRPLPVLALTTDTSVLTSISNDYSYELIFSKQVEALGSENDAFIAISTSGTSLNILKALEKANAMSMLTVGLAGTPDSQMTKQCDFCLAVDEGSTPRIQEVHHLVLHLVAELLEILLFTDKNE